MAKVEKVLIVGAGIGGLANAAALGQLGVEVHVAEIKPNVGVFGVGINQPANSLRALAKIGVLDEILAAGVVYTHYGFYDYRENLIVDIPSLLGGEDVPPNCALSRRTLHQILIGAADRAGADVRYGTSVEDWSEAGDHVDVTFADGSADTYDLVVGFDGIKSAMRKRLFGDGHDPVYAGSAVWRVTVPRPAAVDACDVYQSPRNKAGYIPLTEDTMYLLLVNPEAADARYAREDFPRLLRERLEGYEGRIADIREELPDDAEIVYSPLSEVLLPPPWHQGRVVLGGDAAHACTPHITQGAAMALEDATVLAEELDGTGDVEAALVAYTGRRYPRAKFVQEVSRGILDAEMAIDAETLPIAAEHMAAELPGQFAGVDEFLNQAA